MLRSQQPPEQMAGALRAAVRSIDPQLPLTQLESMERVVDEGQAPRRFTTALVSSFAAAAVLLALLGIYGVIAYSTAQRTQEMAIRLALGSQRSSVMRLILISSAKLGLLGCGIGALAAVFATRLLALAAVCRGSGWTHSSSCWQRWLFFCSHSRHRPFLRTVPARLSHRGSAGRIGSLTQKAALVYFTPLLGSQTPCSLRT